MNSPEQSLDKSEQVKIPSETFCILPWIHLHVDTLGQVRPCCVSSLKYGSINEYSTEALLNSAKSHRLKKQFLDGEKPKSCSQCFSRELGGKRSIRQENNSQFKHLITETLTAKSSSKIHYLDIRFSNLCNLKCRTCWHGASSSWYDDALALKRTASKKKVIASIENIPDFLNQLAPHLDYLEQIYFAGGEPLITPEHYRLLQFLIDKKHTDIQLKYNTNLTLLRLEQHHIIDLWSHFRSVHIGISIDQLYDRASYVRSGLKWNTFIANFRKLKKELPGAQRYITPTISTFNIKDLISIYEYFLEEELIEPDGIYLNILERPYFYNIQSLASKDKATVNCQITHYLNKTDIPPSVHESFKECLS